MEKTTTRTTGGEKSGVRPSCAAEERPATQPSGQYTPPETNSSSPKRERAEGTSDVGAGYGDDVLDPDVDEDIPSTDWRREVLLKAEVLSGSELKVRFPGKCSHRRRPLVHRMCDDMNLTAIEVDRFHTARMPERPGALSWQGCQVSCVSVRAEQLLILLSSVILAAGISGEICLIVFKYTKASSLRFQGDLSHCLLVLRGKFPRMKRGTASVLHWLRTERPPRGT
jgi:hypothetical protein